MGRDRRGASMSRIVLCGIVRNEERTIERMLRSASDVLGGSLSAVLLADTGSTDATVATAERVCAEIAARHPLHAEVRSHPWEDFGANRTRVLAEACALGADFALMLDADETLVGRAPTEPLVEDAYMVEVRGDGSASYWLPLLVSAGRSWHYTGVTHEALAETGRFPRIESFGIVHHHDGANRATKFERDRELLEAELARDPQHARSVFYLARTYWCMGDFERATDLFDRRAAMGGWPEEAFFARYQAALVRRSIEGLLAAWELFPQRGEPLYQALRLLRERRMWQTA